jgi:cobalt-zinc-cadmium efflux system outer membrane protein
MGLSPVAPITFVPDSPARVTEPADPAPIIQTRNPAVAVARARYEVAERDLAVEARRQYPDLEIGPGLGREDGIDEFRLGFSLPIPIFNANRAAIARAQAARDLASLEVDAAIESALAEAAAARAAIAAARERRRILEEEVAPMVDAQFADVRRLAELGEIQVFMLMVALTRRLDARLNLIEAARDEALAATRLLEVLGPENEP